MLSSSVGDELEPTKENESSNIVEVKEVGEKRKRPALDGERVGSDSFAPDTVGTVVPAEASDQEYIKAALEDQATLKVKAKRKKYEYRATLIVMMVYIDDPDIRDRHEIPAGVFDSEAKAFVALLDTVDDPLLEVAFDDVVLTLWHNESSKVLFEHLFAVPNEPTYSELKYCYFRSKFLSEYRARKNKGLRRTWPVLKEIERLFNDENVDLCDQDDKPYIKFRIDKKEV
jgi:hypothetical protein